MTWFEWFLLLIIVLLLIILLLRRALKRKKPKRAVIGMYEGWLVTWLARSDAFAEVRGENRMRLIYGRAYIYNDGYYESIPETYRLTYRVAGEVQRRFDPFDDWPMIRRYQDKQDGRAIPFCDGTETFMQIMFGGNTYERHGQKKQKKLGWFKRLIAWLRKIIYGEEVSA